VDLPSTVAGAEGVRGRRPAVGEPVLDRAFRLLGCFQPGDAALSLASLSARTAIPKATALRLARKLVEQGALERQDDGSYVPGLRLLELASLAPRGHGLRAIALPYMEDLHVATRQHVLLAVREEHASVLVERLSAHEAGRMMYRVGGRMPLHATGVGLVLLAHADFVTREEVLRKPLIIEPESIRVSDLAVRRRLDAVRREGIAVMARPHPEPMVSLAAPIFGRGGEIVAAVSVVAPDGGPRPRELRAAVVTTARAISRGLLL